METRRLGSSDLELSVVTYGAFAIGGTLWAGTQKTDAIDAIKASIDHGISTIDTAPVYGMGLSEELIGEAIKGRDRTQLQILSKAGLIWDGSNSGSGVHHFDATDNNGKMTSVYKYASKKSVIREVEQSLKRLGTDYIDLLQIHWPDITTPISETMEALQQLIDEGKIRYGAVSNYSVPQLEEAKKTLNIVSNQVPYSMLNRKIEKELIAYATENNLGIIAYSPMERGLLTGKYFENAELKKDDHRHNYFKQFDLAKVKALIDFLRPMATDKKASVAQLVLKWTSLQPGITVVLAGARNAEQAISNAKSMELELSNEELQLIDKELNKF